MSYEQANVSGRSGRTLRQREKRRLPIWPDPDRWPEYIQAEEQALARSSSAAVTRWAALHLLAMIPDWSGPSPERQAVEEAARSGRVRERMTREEALNVAVGRPYTSKL